MGPIKWSDAQVTRAVELIKSHIAGGHTWQSETHEDWPTLTAGPTGHEVLINLHDGAGEKVATDKDLRELVERLQEFFSQPEDLVFTPDKEAE